MIVTREFLMRGATTSTGGWTKAQFACLGMRWPPDRGWMYTLSGKEISDECARKFLALRRVETKEALFD